MPAPPETNPARPLSRLLVVIPSRNEDGCIASTIEHPDRSSSDHDWVVEQFKSLTTPLETCEPVLSEVLFLLKRAGLAPDPLFEMIERDVLRPSFLLRDEFQAVRKLLQKYKSLPTSLADACLVRMSETTPQSVVLTLDRDFLVYRRNRRHAIPLLVPFL